MLGASYSHDRQYCLKQFTHSIGQWNWTIDMSGLSKELRWWKTDHTCSSSCCFHEDRVLIKKPINIMAKDDSRYNTEHVQWRRTDISFWIWVLCKSVCKIMERHFDTEKATKSRFVCLESAAGERKQSTVTINRRLTQKTAIKGIVWRCPLASQKSSDGRNTASWSDLETDKPRAFDWRSRESFSGPSERRQMMFGRPPLLFCFWELSNGWVSG